MRPFLTPIRMALILLMIPAFLLLGALGFVVVEGWSFSDSLYMSLITLSTLGFSEVHPLSPAGRGVVAVVVLLSLAAMPVLGAMVTTWFFENTFVSLFKERRMKRQLDHLEKHVIICGLGRMGLELAQRLETAGKTFVAIEQNGDILEDVRQHHPHWLVLHGDATSMDLLKDARVDRAETLVAALSSDADNLYLLLNAKEVAPDAHLIARAESSTGARRLSQLGVNHIVTPVEIGARRISNLILSPHLVEFMDNIASTHGQSVQIYTYQVSEGDRLCGKALNALEIPHRAHLLVVSIESAEGTMRFGPQADTVLKSGDRLFLTGPPENLPLFEALARGEGD